jgi:hypothetical protein
MFTKAPIFGKSFDSTSFNNVVYKESTPTILESRDSTTLEKKKSEKEPSIWECSSCTYHNEISASICNICGSAKPKASVQESEKVSMEKAEEEAICTADLIFHQLKSRAIQSLSALLHCANSARALISANALPDLLK